MDKEFHKRKLHNYGIAFITTDSDSTAQTLKRKLGNIKRDIKKNDPQAYKQLKAHVFIKEVLIFFRDGQWKLHHAPVILFGKI